MREDRLKWTVRPKDGRDEMRQVQASEKRLPTPFQSPPKGEDPFALQYLAEAPDGVLRASASFHVSLPLKTLMIS